MQLITVNVRDEGQRFDKFLAKYLPAAPKSFIYKMLRKKNIGYLKGESNISLCNEYNIPYRNGKTILEWVNKYKSVGEMAFEESTINKSYSKELKLRVIQDYINGIDSLEGLANKYNISKGEIVRAWVLKYNEGIEIKDYNPKGDVYTMKSRKTTVEERLEIVNYALANSVKDAADKYTVPYVNVYQWVKKLELSLVHGQMVLLHFLMNIKNGMTQKLIKGIITKKDW